MTQTHLIIPDNHAHWEHDNARADWLGLLIGDVRPDVVISIGDSADLPSLASYDKGTRAAVGRTYKADINAHLDFQERLWSPVRRLKKKMPRRIFLEGNHEHRIEKALDASPELDGTISFRDLDLDSYYTDVIRYEGNTPGIVEVDGVYYAHYFTSGNMGRAVSGKNAAASLIGTNLKSCTMGHSHTLDFATRSTVGNNWVMGLVCGCYQDYDAAWAGNQNKQWWRGVVIKRGVEDGKYDPEFVSLKSLKDAYG